MTPFRLRLLVSAFLAIATAISVNALYFQTPRFATRGASLVAEKIEIPAPAPTPAPAPAAAPAKPAEPARSLVTAAIPGKSAPEPAHDKVTAATHPSGLVRAIQRKLVHFGYKSLPQDGVAGPDTRAAILSAEFEQGLPLTGQPRDNVLTALYFLEASGRTSLGSSERFERDPRLIKEVQDLLAKLGYTSGPINGRLDNWTRDAIRKFEADRRLNTDGRLGERVLLEMINEKGEPLLSKG